MNMYIYSKPVSYLLLQKLFSFYFWGACLISVLLSYHQTIFVSFTVPSSWQSNNMYIPAPPQKSLFLLPYFFSLSPLCHLSLFRLSLFQLLSLELGIFTGPLQYSKYSSKYFINAINFILSYNPPNNFMG